MQTIPWDGQRIRRPGIYSNIPLDDYHRGDICDGPSLSSSSLRALWSSSPAHFWDASPLNPLRAPEKDKKEWIIGRAAHHLICGEAGFAQRYVIRPDKAPDGREWHGSNGSCKKWMDAAKRERKMVLTPEMTEDIKGMAVALGNNSLMRAGILSGLVERSMFWRDRKTGVWLKARPDVISTSSGDYADLKTTTSVAYLETQYALGEFGYHQQGALVLEGARDLGLEVSSFSLVWVEKTRPYCVRVQTVIDDDLVLGAHQNRDAIDTFHACFTAKHWPGPGDDRADAEFIQLSDRKREQIKARLEHKLREAA